jgi:tRNA modification GTPase
VDLHAHADSLDDLAQLASLIDLALTNEQSSSWSNRLICTHRQRGLLLDAVARLNAASEVISQDRSTSGPSRPEEIAAELRHALDAIGAITGEVPPDDVLGLVFSSFCVGK